MDWPNMPLYFPPSDAEGRVYREAPPPYPEDDLGKTYDGLDDVSIKATPLPVAKGAKVQQLEA